MLLTELIRRAMKCNGVVVAYVYGNFGSGKTSYALWTAYEVLGSWDRVLAHLFFDPAEAALKMKKAIDTGRRLPVIIMDDAGLWLDRMTWWERDKVAFMQFFNLIRSVAAGLIFTTPTEELPKQILRKTMIRVKVTPLSDEEGARFGELYSRVKRAAEELGLASAVALATGYRVKTLPSFTQFVEKHFYDLFPLHYPIFREYEAKRRKALKHYFERWSEAVKLKPKLEDAVNLIREKLEAGAPKSEIVRELVRRGVKVRTAYNWVRRVAESLASGS